MSHPLPLLFPLPPPLPPPHHHLPHDFPTPQVVILPANSPELPHHPIVLVIWALLLLYEFVFGM